MEKSVHGPDSDDNPPKIAVRSHSAPSTCWMQEQTGTSDRVAAHAQSNCLRRVSWISMAPLGTSNAHCFVQANF